MNDCDRPTRSRTAELCNTHYFRVRRTGQVGPAEIWDRKPSKCSADGCDGRGDNGGLCLKHRRRVSKGGATDYSPPLRWGETNLAWKGNQVGYNSAHDRVRNRYGAAKSHTCRCGSPAAHWAYLHNDPNELGREAGPPYSGNPDCYEAMCVPCHKAFDLAYLAGQAKTG